MVSETFVKIFTPIGMLGYGYDEMSMIKAIEDDGATAIIADSGSTDSGPQKLGLGKTTVPKESYARDLKPMVDAAAKYKVKVIISSAGGDGSNDHVDLLADIAKQHASGKGYALNIVTIYSEISKAVVLDALNSSKLRPCGAGVPEINEDEIEKSSRIVAQMGAEPFLEAMNQYPSFDIIIAGRAYDPSPYAAYCYYRGLTNMGINYHMGKVMECGGLCLTPKSKSALAIISQDKFEIRPVNEGVYCKKESLAAHTLYEKSRPDILLGPGGALNLEQSQYEEIAEFRSTVATGARFIPEVKYTVKLEGAKVCGYRAVFIGSISDPILISQVQGFIANVKQYVQAAFPTQEYNFKFDVYGNTDPSANPSSIFLVGDAVASSQELAVRILSTARIAVVHGPYPFQKATSGNFAMPIIPLEVPLGIHCEFNIYHLMEIDDPVALFPISYTQIEASTKALPTTNEVNVSNGIDSSLLLQKAKKAAESLESIACIPDIISKPPNPDSVYLHSLTKVIRSKNAGPFELTYDLIFNDDATFEKVKAANILTPKLMAKVFDVVEKDIVALLFFKPANAFKLTIPRKNPSGSFLDNDIHGSQQHVPLMFIEIPKDLLD